MPKKTFDDIVKARKALAKELVEYDDDRKKIDTKIGKIMMGYGIIKKGLEEGHKDIDDLKSQVKASYDTWQKLFAKLDQIKDGLAAVAKETKATRPGLEKFDDAADELSKELTRCGGEMKDLKEEAEELKKVKRLAARLKGDYDGLFDMASAPPADPPKPTLAIA